MGLFDSTSVSSSETNYSSNVETTSISDSYNDTYSTVNNITDAGNVKVNEPKIETSKSWLLPIVAIVTVGLILFFRRKS